MFCLIERTTNNSFKQDLRPDGNRRISTEIIDFSLEIIVHLGLFADDFSPKAGIVFG